MSERVVIVEGVRTPIGIYSGGQGMATFNENLLQKRGD